MVLANGLIRRLRREKLGQNLAEYALLLAMLSLGSIAVVPKLACNIICVFEGASDMLDRARSKIPPGQYRKCLRQC